MCCMRLILLQHFSWVSLFQYHFSHSCYDCSLWWFFPLLCVLFCISPRQWVILEVSCNLFCSADFLPCIYCVFSFFQLSFQILLSSGNHFHLFQVTASWLRQESFYGLCFTMLQIQKRVLDNKYMLRQWIKATLPFLFKFSLLSCL